MLEIQNLSCAYGENTVIRQLNLSVETGSLTAIVGPNGCGKSTLLKAITGILPYSGNILLQGQSLRELRIKDQAKVLGFMPQSRPIPEITVERFVLHGRFPHLNYPRYYRTEDHRAAQRAMEQLHILPLAQRTLPSLSGGERQKVYFAMLLAQETPVLLLDEPTAYLDISHKFELMQIARQLTRQGKTVVMVVHDLDLAMQYADQIAVMERGQIRICSDPETIYRSGQLERTFHIRVEQIQTASGPHFCFLPNSPLPD